MSESAPLGGWDKDYYKASLSYTVSCRAAWARVNPV